MPLSVNNCNIKTICARCKYYNPIYLGDDEFLRKCLNPKAPYTDYVRGAKNPYKINDGACEFYEDREVEGQAG